MQNSGDAALRSPNVLGFDACITRPPDLLLIRHALSPGRNLTKLTAAMAGYAPSHLANFLLPTSAGLRQNVHNCEIGRMLGWFPFRVHVVMQVQLATCTAQLAECRGQLATAQTAAAVAQSEMLTAQVLAQAEPT